MNRNLMLLAFSIFILISGSIAHADVINGDFSLGLANWTPSGDVTIRTADLTGMTGNYAVLGANVEFGQSTISQTLTAAYAGYVVSFDYYFSSFDDYDWTNDISDNFITLYDAATGLELSSFGGEVLDAQYGHFEQVLESSSDSIVFVLNEAAGHADNHQGTNSWIAIDNVSVGNPVPEPGTMVLLGSGLIGLAAFLKRSNKK